MTKFAFNDPVIIRKGHLQIVSAGNDDPEN